MDSPVLRPETPKANERLLQEPVRRTSTTPRRGRQRSLTDLLNNPHDPVAVLLCGLEPTWIKNNRPETLKNAEKDYEASLEAFEKVKQIRNLYMETHAIIPDSRPNIEELKRTIRDGTGPEGGNKAWDGVLLDYRTRCDIELTPLFEELCNYVHETLPGSKLLFSSGDHDYHEVLKRVLKVGPIH